MVQEGDEEISAFDDAATSSDRTRTVRERESVPIVEGGEPPVLEVRFIPIPVYFNCMVR